MDVIYKLHKTIKSTNLFFSVHEVLEIVVGHGREIFSNSETEILWRQITERVRVRVLIVARLRRKHVGTEVLRRETSERVRIRQILRTKIGVRIRIWVHISAGLLGRFRRKHFGTGRRRVLKCRNQGFPTF